MDENFWTITGIIITTILSVIAIIVSLNQNKRKKLSYEVNSLFPLFEIKSELLNDFEIKYKNEIIKQLYISEITIENYGSLPIKKDDFEEPIKILFKNCKRVFSVEILDASPENLIIPIENEQGNNPVIINPLLLNPSDFIKFKFIIEGKDVSIDIQSRIIDVKSIDNKKFIKYQANKRYTWVLLCFGIILLFITYTLIDNFWIRMILSLLSSGTIGYSLGYLNPIFIKKK